MCGVVMRLVFLSSVTGYDLDFGGLDDVIAVRLFELYIFNDTSPDVVTIAVHTQLSLE